MSKMPAKRKRTNADIPSSSPNRDSSSLLTIDEWHATEDDGEDSDDCILEEPHVSCIVLDSTVEEEEGTSNSTTEDGQVDDDTTIIEDESNEKLDETIVAQDETAAVDNEFLFSINFKYEETYKRLKDAVTKGIKEAMFSIQKSIKISEDLDTFELNVVEVKNDETDLFIFDSDPSTNKSKDVPKYSSSFRNVFDDKVAEIVPTGDVNDKCVRAAKPKNLCFNCEGEHSIRDCTEPKNLNKIRTNRGKFQSTRTERYHVDSEQRFGNLLPGEMSDDLRKALGLQEAQLPLHIYRMRMIGYPPGWLESAKVFDSGLTLFNSEGNEIVGNKEENGNASQDKFDLKKIISFPGFNVDPPFGTIDQSNYYGVPPINPAQRRDVLLESLRGSAVESYKRKKLTISPKTNNQNCGSTVDMDIGDDSDVEMTPEGPLNPPLPADEGVPTVAERPPPPASPSDDEKNSTILPERIDLVTKTPKAVATERACDSPSLDDLNKQKRLLLDALDDSSLSLANTTAVSNNDDSLIDDIMALDTTGNQSIADTEDELNDTTKSVDQPISEDQINAAAEVTINTSLKNNHENAAQTPVTPLQGSKETVVGTPILKSISPFSTLPTGKSWSVGVTDVIDFENLPESVGKYSKMKTLINKVRTVVKELNDEY